MSKSNGFVSNIEEQNAGCGLGRVQILWDFGKLMGKPKAWIEIVPGLFGLVFRTNPSKIIISYADAKRWIEPDREMPLSAENPTMHLSTHLCLRSHFIIAPVRQTLQKRTTMIHLFSFRDSLPM
jgi:hypothetical protein